MRQKLDVLTLEVGSTITKANGFCFHPDESLTHVAQGFAATSVLQGDVSVGVEQALHSLTQASGYDVEGADCFINSSAAGGLRVTVHGLTLNMTARAAKEASLGAGAIIRKLTAGQLFDHDLDELKEIKPNLVILAGGVDYGDTTTVMAIAERLVPLDLYAPIIYAGNVALQKPIQALAAKHNRELWIAENVFPEVDVLNVVPLRRLIHDAFSKHIIHAPGMSKLGKYTQEPVIPTPGAVLLATRMFAQVCGDAMVVDVGGATTDVHSVTDGSPEFTRKMIDPEPREKRTVEGDLGVYVNANQVLQMDPTGAWKTKAHLLKAMPQEEQEKELTRWLCQTATVQAVQRHAGTISEMYTAFGRKQIVKGKDLTGVKYVIGTGGALTRVEGGDTILAQVCRGPTTHLLPPPEARILLDRNYLFSALGTVAQKHPKQAGNSISKLLGVPPRANA